MSTIQTFMLRIVQDRVSFGGWVSFNHLETMSALTGTNIRDEFMGYCRKHGCTLILHGSESKAPWSDFRNFLLGQNPDD